MRTLTIISILAASLLLTAVAPTTALAVDSVTIDSAPQDSTSTTAFFSYTINGNYDAVECELDGEARPCGTNFALFNNLSVGEHTFLVRVSDSADGSIATASHTWTVTAPPPVTIEITQAPDNPSYTPGGEIRWTSTGDEVSTECSLDGAAYFDCSSFGSGQGSYYLPFFPRLAPGEHTFDVRINGISSTASDSHTWTILEPSITITTRPDASTYNTTARFEWELAGSYGAIQCVLDGIANACESPHDLSNLSQGEHTFFVRAFNMESFTVKQSEPYRWTVLAEPAPPVEPEPDPPHPDPPPLEEPTANAAASTPFPKRHPRRFDVDGSMSYAADGSSIVSYVWTYKARIISRKRSFPHVLPSFAARTLTLTVTDDKGLSSSASVRLAPRKPAPLVRVKLPVPRFAFDRAYLSSKAKRVVNRARVYAKGAKRVRLDGHTDSIGTRSYNRKLSQRRASTTVRYLLRGFRGSSRPNSVRAYGWGESRPVASNRTAEGRALNRRAIIRIIRR